MIFNELKPIYLQIADFITDKIIAGQWQEDNRIPSVRELGVELEVNPNTVMRAYEWLSEREIIYNKRGVGFFVNGEAKRTIISFRKDKLINEELREIAKRMSLLGISVEEITEHLTKYINNYDTAK